MNIALLGAESSGKSTLAKALVQELQALQDRQAPPRTDLVCGPNTRVRAIAVPEALRSWCEAQGRTPLAHEQADIAHHQHRQIQAARTQLGPQGWLVADTTPLMTAVYSEHYWGDDSLTPWALGVQRTFDLTLLMGLDLPWQADGPWRDGPAVQLAVDSRLRAHLLRTATPFQTLYGQGSQRVGAALQAIGTALTQQNPQEGDALKNIKTRAETLLNTSGTGQIHSKFWTACEACSDPDCEHTLFTRLMAQRAPAP